MADIDNGKRVFDNTLPQAAFSYAIARGGECVDPASKLCFEKFVDAYVNTPEPRAVLPSRDPGGGNGADFIDLWMEEAKKRQGEDEKSISWNQGSVPIKLSSVAVFQEFAIDVGSNVQAWRGFLLFQLSPGIAEQFMSRVLDWKDRIGAALQEIKDMEPTKGMLHDDLERFRNLFDEYGARDGRRIHGEYLRWIASRNGDQIRLVDFALAYGFDWYRRGHSYSRLENVLVSQHPLRVDLTAGATGAKETAGPSLLEISWHGAILESLQKGAIIEGGLLDALRGLRKEVQGPGFQQGMVDSERQKGPDLIRFEIAYNALRSAGIDVAVVRRSALPPTTPMALALALGGAISSWKPALVASATLFVSNLVTTEALAKQEFKVRRKLAGRRYAAKFSWRAFEMKGIEIGKSEFPGNPVRPVGTL